MDDLEQPEGVETPVDDLRASLAESLTEQPATVEQPEAGQAERPRGPDGKFIAKETGEPEPVVKPAQSPAGEQKTEGVAEEGKPETEPQAATASPSVEPPAHWSATDKEKFSALPAEGRQHFLDMYKRVEAWYTPKLQKLATIERDYQGIPELFAPHSEGLRSQGKVPADIIRAWATVEQTLMTNKAAIDSGQAPNERGAAVIAHMIREYRVNPAEIARILTGGQPEATEGQPSTAQADPRVARLEQQLQSLTAAEEERRTAMERERIGGAQQQIDAFANKKDAEGNLENPFFAEVEKDIEILAQLDRAQGKTPELSDLYRRATRANDEVYRKLLDLNNEKEAKRVAAEKKARTEAAQRTAVSISGAPGSATVSSRTVPTGNASVADDLRASLEELRA